MKTIHYFVILLLLIVASGCTGSPQRTEKKPEISKTGHFIYVSVCEKNSRPSDCKFPGKIQITGNWNGGFTVTTTPKTPYFARITLVGGDIVWGEIRRGGGGAGGAPPFVAGVKNPVELWEPYFRFRDQYPSALNPAQISKIEVFVEKDTHPRVVLNR